MYKRTLALTLCLLLAMAALSGCGSYAPVPQTPAATADPAPADPTQAEASWGDETEAPSAAPCDDCGANLVNETPQWGAPAEVQQSIADTEQLADDIATGVYYNFTPDRLLPYTHYAGGGDTQPMLAVITAEHEMDNYTKYQLTYLSCTCRDVAEQVQHLLYVELNNNAASAEEATIRNIRYDFWGDPAVNPENGMTYENYESEWLPYLQYKSKADIDALAGLADLTAAPDVQREGQSVPFVDAYTGSTVSVNNSLSILHALFAYHAEKYYE